ncbi:MAG: Uma2 family endonuclease [Pyrinomonadaceae bacterium]
MTTLPKSKQQYYSVEEYLEIDRATGERWEYVNGRIYQMAGESGEHGDISTNLAIEIGSQLKGKDCRVRSKATKVRSGSVSKGNQLMKGMFSYPDIVVICGEPEYHDKFRDIVLNPKVIIEILSDSTEKFDRTEKFTRYRMFNPTLTDYILVSQDEPLIEQFVRQDDETWKLYTFVGLDKIFPIESIECELRLTEVYDRIEFSDDVLSSLSENTYF